MFPQKLGTFSREIATKTSFLYYMCIHVHSYHLCSVAPKKERDEWRFLRVVINDQDTLQSISLRLHPNWPVEALELACLHG